MVVMQWGLCDNASPHFLNPIVKAMRYSERAGIDPPPVRRSRYSHRINIR